MSYEKSVDLAEAGAPPPRDSLFGMVIDGLNSLGSLLIFAVMLLMCADVLARDILNRPVDGVAEMVAMSIIAIVFLQLASTLRHNRMSRADIFIDVFAERNPRAGNFLLAAFNGLGAFVLGVVFYATLPVFLKAWGDSEFIGVEGIFTMPTWPVRLVVLIGSAATLAQYMVIALNHLRISLRGRP